MSKIAGELDQALARRLRYGAPGAVETRTLARGNGWYVCDVLCTSGPQDRPFEEKAPCVFITVVASGIFQCRSAAGHHLVTPGSLMLGHADQWFERRLEATGVRCFSFRYAPDYFDHLAAEAGARPQRTDVGVWRLPPSRALSPLVARVWAGLAGSSVRPWEDLIVQVAIQTMRQMHNLSSDPSGIPSGAAARVATTSRFIQRHLNTPLSVVNLAREAGLSPFHFLRTFKRLTGVTPHQYILRLRLREAAIRLEAETTRILDIALDCGFSDVSNFSRAFRAEFGVSPRVYRGL